MPFAGEHYPDLTTSVGDPDFYQLQVPKGARLEVHLDHHPQPSKVELELLDKNGDLVGASRNGKLESKNLPGGKYYLLLYMKPHSSPPRARYTMRIVAERAGASVTNYRSIGTRKGTLYDLGRASTVAGSDRVVFSAETELPSYVGLGDRLRLGTGGAGQEVAYISTVAGVNEVRLQAPASRRLNEVSFVIERAYNRLQDWEDHRQGDLVGERRREVGVAYDDGPFTYRSHPPKRDELLRIAGSRTSKDCYLRLSVAEGHGHGGRAGKGVVLDGGGALRVGIEVRDDYTVIEGVELRSFGGDEDAADEGRAAVVDVRDVQGVVVDGLLIHEFHSRRGAVSGIAGGPESRFTVRNTVFYDGDEALRLVGDRSKANVENSTVYGMARGGFVERRGVLDVRNTISVENGSDDFDVQRGDQSHNISSDATASGEGSLTGAIAADLFVSLFDDEEDFHLLPSAEAVDAGEDLSEAFTHDIEGDERPQGDGWDIGADENLPSEVAELEIVESDGATEVAEGGETDTYRVALVGKPSADVLVTLETDGETLVEPASLTFTPSNGKVAQTVTVSAVDDRVAEARDASAIEHRLTSNDPLYNGWARELGVHVRDNDEARVVLTETDGETQVVEGRETDTYTVVLTSQPTADVTIEVHPDTETLAAPTSLTFTPSNWEEPQTVRVTGVQDSVDEGAHESRIGHEVKSDDPFYAAISMEPLKVTVLEENGPATVEVVIGPEGGTLVAPSSGVRVVFPPGAVTEEVVVTYVEMDPRERSHVVTPFTAFSLQAVTVNAPPRPVRAFDLPVRVAVPYTAAVCGAQPEPECEELLTLFSRQDGATVWYPIGTSRVMADVNEIQAELKHFTEFSAAAATDTPMLPPEDITLPSVGGEDVPLPSLGGIDASEFTGSATISVPIELPPLAGELALGLSLSYSSNVINSIRNASEVKPEDYGHYRLQASVYGLGWELTGLASITQGSSTALGGVMAAPYLNLGESRVMYYDFSGLEKWETQPISFYRIENNGRCDSFHGDWDCINRLYWGKGERNDYSRRFEVWTHDGAHYVFGEQRRHRDCGRESWNATGYYVTEVSDRHGNRAVIDYLKESTSEGICLGSTPSQHVYGQPYDRAVIPHTIRFYPSGSTEETVQVLFETASRSDIYMGQQTYKLSEGIGLPGYSHHRVAGITVQVRTGSGAWATYRRYRLDNDRYVWGQEGVGGAGHMLLKGVEVQGANGAVFPSWSFTYDTDGGTTTGYDWNHARVTEVEDGYGGRLVFGYGEQSLSCGGGSLGRYVVDSLETYDGLGVEPVSKVGLAYENPRCRIDAVGGNATAWFMGYEKVVRIERDSHDRVLNQLESLYHTTKTRAVVGEIPHAAAGRPYQVQVKLDGRIVRDTRTSWAVEGDVIPVFQNLGLDLALEWLRKQTESENQEGRQRLTEYVYDRTTWPFNYGYPTAIVSRGDTNEPLDDQRTEVSYVHNPSAPPYLLGLKGRVQVYGSRDGVSSTGELLRETTFYYDTDTPSDWTRPPTKGDLNFTVRSNPGGTPSEVQTGTQYDTYGNPTEVWDGNRNETRLGYDPVHHAYVVEAVNALGHFRTYEYDYTRAVLTVETDPNGVATAYRYDDLGRRTAVIRPGDTESAPSKRYRYSDVNGVVTPPFGVKEDERDDEGSGSASYNERWSFYDGLGRRIQTQVESDRAGQVVVVNQRYNALGQVEATSHPYEASETGAYLSPSFPDPTGYDYDGLGRLVETTAADGSEVSTKYAGWDRTVRDPMSRERTYRHDAFGRLVGVNEPGGATTSYIYNGVGELLRVVDAAGHETTVEYDLLGRKVAMNDPDLGEWSYAYDAAGNLIQRTDARGVQVTMVPDALNRLRRKTYSDGTPAMVYGYDAGPNGKGRRTEMSDAGGTVSFGYDERGRLVKESRQLDHPAAPGGSYLLEYGYDKADRVRTVTYPDGEVVTTGYTERGLPENLTSSLGGGYVEGALHDVEARFDELNLGNGVKVDYGYYPPTEQGGRLERLRVGGSLLDVSYGYDRVGNITSQIDRAMSVGEQQLRFTYDGLDRLTGATASGGSIPDYQESYGYDAIGNLTERKGQAYRYGENGAGPHAATGVGANTYRYDANGNMEERTEGGILYTQSWDGENRLQQVSWTDAGGQAHETRFVYDGAGTRLMKIASDSASRSQTTLYIGKHYEATFDSAAPGNNAWVAYDAWVEPDDGTYHNAGALSHVTDGNPDTSLDIVVDQLTLYRHRFQVELSPKEGLGVLKQVDEIRITLDVGRSPVVADVYVFTLPNGGELSWLNRSISDGDVLSWKAPSVPYKYQFERIFVQIDLMGNQPSYRNNPIGFAEIDILRESGAPGGSKPEVMKHYFLGGRRVALRKADNVYFHHGDHMGSTSLTTDGVGQVIGESRYLPYGELRWTSGASIGDIGFTGQRAERSSGLMDYNARHYDPLLGRFLSADTVVPSRVLPQDFNRYSYARNNPLGYIDSGGHVPIIPIAIGAAAVVYMIYDYLAHPDVAYAPDEEMARRPLPPSDLEGNDRALCDWCVDAQKGDYGPAAIGALLDAIPFDKIPGLDNFWRAPLRRLGIGQASTPPSVGGAKKAGAELKPIPLGARIKPKVQLLGPGDLDEGMAEIDAQTLELLEIERLMNSTSDNFWGGVIPPEALVPVKPGDPAMNSALQQYLGIAPEADPFSTSILPKK